MRRGVLGVWVLLSSSAFAANPAPFTFAVPEGFVDITHEAKPPLGVIDDAFYEQAKTLDFLAVKVVDGDAIAAVSAKVANGRPPKVDVAAPDLKLLATSRLKVAGLDCQRVETEGPNSTKVVALLLPGLERWAQLELTVSDPSQYAELVAVFEAAAARTTGLALPKPPPARPDPPAPLVFMIGAGALIGTVVRKLIVGRKRSTAWRKTKKPKKSTATQKSG